MDFLKDVLGEELFKQVNEKVSEYNTAHEDKAVKIGNLSNGDYIGRGKYETLQTDFNSKTEELKQANALINQLKSGDNSAELNAKIKEYEAKVQNLQTSLINEKKSNALKLALTAANVKDVDYVTFKLKQKGDFELDDNGKIKGWSETLKSLKSELPGQFEEKKAPKVNEHKLDPHRETGGITKEEFKKMSYSQRVKLYNEDKETYEKLAK